MATKPRIFISAVSAEFRQTRQMIAQVLLRLGYDPFWQDILSTEAGDLREMLQEKIDSCDGVLQIVGYGYGYEPEKIDLDYGRISYTQFELAYARKIGKKSWVVFAGDDCTRDTPIEELNLPPEDDHPDPAGYQAERRKLQAAWREKLKRTGDLHHEAPDDREMELLVERMKDDMHALLRSERIWRRAILGGIAAVLLLAVTAVGMIGSMRGDQDKQKQDFEDLKELATNDIGIPLDEVTQADIRPEISMFDSTTQSIGYGLQWHIKVNTSPQSTKTIAQMNVKSFYSFDGNTFTEGMQSTWFTVKNATGHDHLFLKFRNYEGEEIGPFKYEMKFEKFAMKDFREKLEQATGLVTGQAGMGQKTWRWGYTMKQWLPAVSRIEYAFDPQFNSKKTIEIPKAPFDEYFGTDWALSLIFFSQPIVAPDQHATLHYRFVYRDGEVGKTRIAKLNQRSTISGRSSFSSPSPNAFKDIEKDDLKVEIWKYDRVLGWGIRFRMPQGIQHKSRDPRSGVLIEYSFDGKTFEEAYSESIHLRDKEAADHKSLFLKLSSQSDETIGPFEYDADFYQAAMKPLREELDRTLKRRGNGQILTQYGNVVGFGSVLQESLPLLSKVVFAFSESMKQSTSLPIPQANFSEYWESKWRARHRLDQYYDSPAGAEKIYIVLTFRDGTKTEIIEQELQNRSGGGFGGGGASFGK